MVYIEKVWTYFCFQFFGSPSSERVKECLSVGILLNFPCDLISLMEFLDFIMNSSSYFVRDLALFSHRLPIFQFFKKEFFINFYIRISKLIILNLFL